uniref:10G08 n=1 Tax=Ips pini TaxID=102803 RepID=Q5FYF7_IPSPI|nr:10G08 [Ips pini]
MPDCIKDLESVVLPSLKIYITKIYITDIKNLTTAGENYGSILLSVNIVIENGKTETIKAVAKAVPKNDFIKNFFMSSLTFKKELYFYQNVIPALKKFQTDQGMKELVDFTAEFYGGRLTLDSNQQEYADEDAVILMENLKVSGYQTMERTVGFDFDTTCLIIKNIAQFHAVPIAMRIKNPSTFMELIKPYLHHTDLFTQSMPEEMQNSLTEDIIKLASENPQCAPYVKALKRKCESCYRSGKNPKIGRELFTTITHNDIWVNNLLIKFDENGIPIGNKLVDYQFLNYDSLGKDLIFFLFDSVQNEVIKRKYDEILRIYHDTFISTLKRLNVDTTPYTYEKLLEELDFAANNTFAIGQTFAMLRPIFAVKESVNEVENLRDDNILQYKEPTKLHKEKLYMLVEEFVKRKWI